MERFEVDDWADQDLLTKDEARERLAVEISRTRTRLAALKTPDDDAEITLLERRLTAMESIRSEYATYLGD
jgi:hypothetical protein